MKISTIKLLIIEFALIIFLILNIFVINIKNIYLLAGILLLFIILTIILLGYEKNRQRFKKDIILNIILYTFIFKIILYVSGIFLGFLRSGYSYSLTGIIKNIVPMLVLTLVCEMLRYCINVKGQNNKLVLILSAIVFIFIDITIRVNINLIENKRILLETIFMILLPSISKNILLTYLSVKFGYNVNIVYLIIMELSIYILPIVPNINDYLSAVINLLFPIYILYSTYKSIEKYSAEREIIYYRKSKKIIYITISILIIIMISLTSGIFPVYGLAVGSNSMHNSIDRGDVVIVQKIKRDKINSLQEGDILVYQYQKKVIVHRIVKKMVENNNITFKTKGDNNKDEDAWVVDEENVIGTTLFKIKYIGYPTVLLNELISK